jgi:enoyl-CoA hydratase
MAQVPAEVFEFSKRQLQQPVRARLAERDGDDEAVLAMWSSDRTRAAIARYLESLKRSR